MEVIDVFFQQFNMKDFADIGVVSFLIYQGLKIVHGTRAVQMLMGLGLLVFLYWMAVSYKLYSLNWLLAHFFDSFFLIAIIIFQDQFRAALASVGTGRKKWIFRKNSDEEMPMEEIIDAAMVFSKERIGAIMVIERTQGLANYISTGTQLQSEIHSDILYSIFQSRSSLHDGAVIFSGGKIAAAGCFLPLSKDIEIQKHMGTRHRAAMGLSEHTDAVILTVSEETGQINFCIDGQFKPCESAGEIRQYLRHLLGGEKLDESLLKKAEGGLS
ncbi:MAG: TIGR00159 family protein [Halobacteriovorax sp.]|nr:TIGR00159 family protein [Halobacteriovorax sp.]|tara:strand:+ start:49122 stop:49934 length:813 start_codon:yes stop_codon:yes gene_type:complete